MHQWLLASIIVFVASVLQSAMGFGFAIIATPFLLFVFNSRDVVQMSIILSFIISIFLISHIKHDIDGILLKRLVMGSIPGTLAGLLFFVHASLDILKLTVSIVILTITILMNYKIWAISIVSCLNGHKISGEAKPDNKLITKLSPQKPEKNEMWSEVLVGLCAGVLTTGIGMPGVPLAIYFYGRGTPKKVARGTTLAFFIVIYIVSITIQVTAGEFSIDTLMVLLKLVPASIIGIVMGNIMFSKINQNMFQEITKYMLLVTGIYMLFKAVSAI